MRVARGGSRAKAPLLAARPRYGTLWVFATLYLRFCLALSQISSFSANVGFTQVEPRCTWVYNHIKIISEARSHRHLAQQQQQFISGVCCNITKTITGWYWLLQHSNNLSDSEPVRDEEPCHIYVGVLSWHVAVSMCMCMCAMCSGLGVICRNAHHNPEQNCSADRS